MSKKIFVSCVYEDIKFIAVLNDWIQRKLIGDVILTTETEDKRQLGLEAIKAHIRKKIEDSDCVVVLVGDNTHNHDWIRAEVELANSFNKKVLCMRIPGTTGAFPEILRNRKIIQFDPSLFKTEL